MADQASDNSRWQRLNPVSSPAAALATVLLLGIIARAALSFTHGYYGDIELFAEWMRRLHADGLGGIYGRGGANYPPLYLLILWAYGQLLAAIDPALLTGQAARVLLRVPAFAADIVIAILLAVEVCRLVSPRAAVAAAALYFLNPVTLYDSAYWGQVDSVHTVLIVAALMALNRSRPGIAGVFTALALLQKLQSIVFVPLILFDVYRWWRWRGIQRHVLGAVVAVIAVLSPFMVAGNLEAALLGGYRVVGKYNHLSISAFNLWQLAPDPETSTDSPPAAIVELAAHGDVSVQHESSFLLKLTWRRISMVLFCVLLALTLSIYRRFGSAEARFLTAGVLSLLFFTFLTEMHERYAFPVIALLPLWAVRGQWRERIYMLISLVLLMNLVYVLPVDEISTQLSVLVVMLFFAMLLWLSASKEQLTQPPIPAAVDEEVPVSLPPSSALVNWFCRLTWLAVCVFLAGTVWLIFQTSRISTTTEPAHLYLSDMEPVAQHQEYGDMRDDRSVDGSILRIGNTYYLRGLGTHAPSTVTYTVPDGFDRFYCQVGVDKYRRGSVKIRVLVGDEVIAQSDVLTPESAPVVVNYPVTPGARVTLVAEPAEETRGDHVDWALARFEKTQMEANGTQEAEGRQREPARTSVAPNM